jgi:hypothetical protein
MYFKEVVASLYAWDLLDEGVDQALDVLQVETGTNSTYLVALMHDEKRPLTDFYYPHNARRKVYWTEDSRAYWNTHDESYADSRIKPRRSDSPELRDNDWLATLVEASRKRGMSVGAELSHTWIDKERTRAELLDCVQRDIHGRPFDGQICFNHPDVRAYAKALYVDLAKHYDIDYVMTCVRGFNPGGERAVHGVGPSAAPEDPELRRLVGVTLGGCFCVHCQAAAERRGLDWKELTDRLAWLADGFDRFNHRQAFDLALLLSSSANATSLLLELPELQAFLAMRAASLTEFFAEVRTAVKAAAPNVDLRLNHYAGHPELMGLDLRSVAGQLDSIRSSDYSEQSGDPARMAWKRRYLHNIRRTVGLDMYFLSAVSPRPRATPELVEQGVLISAECGADALTIGHYDGSWLHCLRAVKSGLAKAGIEIKPDAPIWQRAATNDMVGTATT